MAFKRPRARILERTITAGNGPYATSLVDAGWNRFSSYMSVGDTTIGTVVEPGVAWWTGVLTYSAANQITLTTVEEFSGTFGAGTKEIMAGAMASQAALPRDIAGAIVTGGSLTAYTVTSFSAYDSLARMDGGLIAFTPHTNNGATVTLNVDGLGFKPLRPAPGVELQANVLIAGTSYMAVYNNSSAVWYLHGFGVNINTDGTLAANSDLVVSSQKAVKTYADSREFPSGTAMLFVQTAAPTRWTKSTTHNDKALRIVSGAASSGGTNAFSTVMAQSVVGGTAITIAQMPAHTHSVPVGSVSNDGTTFDAPGPLNPYNAQAAGTSGSQGSGNTHNHTITMAIQYVDAIIATKD